MVGRHHIGYLPVDVLGIIALQQHRDNVEELGYFVEEQIEKAKLQGLEATRKVVNTWKNHEEYNWKLMAISNETANKLLQGEFKTFDELYDSIYSKPEDINDNIEILYREIYNESRHEYIYVIETIFINE